MAREQEPSAGARLPEQERAREARQERLKARQERETEALRDILKDGLSRDPHIDFDQLKRDPPDLRFGRRRPRRADYLPEAPSGIGKLNPRSRRGHERQLEEADLAYRQALREYKRASAQHQRREKAAQRETEAHNRRIEQLQARFADGDAETVEGYFYRVLDASPYPAGIQLKPRLRYISESRALAIETELPPLENLPASEDDTLYALVLAGIALRCLHEIFQADRSALVERLVFNGFVSAIDPATGRPGRFCLAAVSTTRARCLALNLELVAPVACLHGLGGRLSRSPANLQPVQPVDAEAAANPQDTGAAIASLVADLQRRIDELEATAEAQRERVTELESQLQRESVEARDLEETDAMPAVRELTERSETDAENPPSRVAPSLPDAELVESLRVFVEAQGAFVDCLARQLPMPPVDFLVSEGLLERSDADWHAARATARGEAWYAKQQAAGADMSEDAREPESSDALELDEPAAPPPASPANLALVATMESFVAADGEFVDYIDQDLAKSLVDKLEAEGLLARQKSRRHRLRATAEGLTWYWARTTGLDETDANRAEQPIERPPTATDADFVNTLRVFVEAEGALVDCLEQGLSMETVDYLAAQRWLERNWHNRYKARVTAAGRAWYYDQLTAASPAKAPESEAEAEPEPDPSDAATVLESADEEFYQTVYEAPDTDDAGAPIPPRPEAYAELLETMRVFMEAEGGFRDAVRLKLPQDAVDSLVAAGLLRSHIYHSHWLKPTDAGERWYRENTAPLPAAEPGEAGSTRLIDLIRGASSEVEAAAPDDAPAANADASDADTRPMPALYPAEADDAIDLTALAAIVSDPGSDAARVLNLLRQGDWACPTADLEAHFDGRFISEIVDEINEIALDSVGDNIIDEEGGRCLLHEEYRAGIAGLLRAG